MLEKYLNGNSFIEIELRDEIPEENIKSGIPFINEDKLTILDLYNFIQQVKKSSCIGILVKIKRLNIGFARADEIRALFSELKSNEKKVFIYLEDVGNIEYFIATSADKIFIPPWTTINLLGLSFDSFFIKELLDSLDIEPEIEGFGDYKSAADMFNRNEISPYHKEMMSAVLDNHFNNLLKTVSVARNIKESELKKIIDNNPLNPSAAMSHMLVDKIAYENEVTEFIENEADKKIKFIKYEKFKRNYKITKIVKNIVRFLKGKNKYIGYINISGMITQGESRKGSGFVNTCGSDTACNLIKKACDDKSISGVVVRVLSPGGSALASDLIRNEIKILSDKKPVVISMSDVAASGGYMVSLSSESIFANSFTITGSIGVVAGKFNFKNLLNKYGIRSETLQKGKMASIYSVNKSFTKSEKTKFIKLIKDMYEDFIKLVSIQRKLSLEATEKAAQGRVWTGEDAKNYGLVDEVGSLSASIEKIKAISDIDGEEVFIKEFKAKNKISLSNIGKFSQMGVVNDYLSIYEILNKERLYAILPYNSKIK